MDELQLHRLKAEGPSLSFHFKTELYIPAEIW